MIRQVDNAVQRLVDAGAHVVMRRCGVSRWFVEYGVDLAYLALLIFDTVQSPNWPMLALCLAWLVLSELARHGRMQREAAGLPFARNDGVYHFMKVVFVWWSIADAMNREWTMSARSALIVLSIYLRDTPTDPPPSKKREREPVGQLAGAEV